MDFVHDQLATGRKLRVLTIVDSWSRFSPAVDPRFGYRGEDVVATLERVCREHGCPQSIRVDQGSKFISRDLDLWALPEGRRARVLAPGQADGQLVHRVVQRQVPGRMSERPQVPDA